MAVNHHRLRLIMLGSQRNQNRNNRIGKGVPATPYSPSASPVKPIKTMKPKTTDEFLAEFLARFDTLDENVTTGLKDVNDKLGIQGGLIQEFGDKLGNCTERIETFNKETRRNTQSVAKLEKKVGQHDLEIRMLTEKLEMMDRESRKKTIIIEGVREDHELGLHEMVGKLFEDMNLSYDVGACDKILRRGVRKQQRANGKAVAPRVIAVTFVREGRKAEFFKNLKNLKDIDRWKTIYFGDDLTELQRAEARDLRGIAAHARSKGHRATVRGVTLQIDGNKYMHRDIHHLPADLSLEAAKQVEFDQGKGIGFQGHPSLLSNMSKCSLEYEGEEFKSVEEAFQYQKAICCGDPVAAGKILQSADAYRAKMEGDKVTSTPKWDQKEEQVMLDLLRVKFKKNQQQRKALIDTGDKVLVEFTRDRKWGCGLPLSKMAETKVDKLPGKNLLGDLLNKVRDELGQENGQDLRPKK